MLKSECWGIIDRIKEFCKIENKRLDFESCTYTEYECTKCDASKLRSDSDSRRISRYGRKNNVAVVATKNDLLISISLGDGMSDIRILDSMDVARDVVIELLTERSHDSSRSMVLPYENI